MVSDNPTPAIRPGILSAVGHTPLVKLDRLFPNSRGQIYGKLEFLNPGGSCKDRPALLMLESALAAGAVQRGGTVIESSSGNMAVGLAQASRLLDLHMICVVDVKATATNIKLLKAYGAQVELVTQPHPDTGDWLDARLARVQQLLETTPGAWWPNQYENVNNARSHAEGTAAELAMALGRAPSYILAAASTCGTLGGLVRWRQTSRSNTNIVAVDVVGSDLFGAPPGIRRIPGIGSSMQPKLVDADSLRVEIVDSADCVDGCRLLLEREAILAGGSSGALVAAASRIAPMLGENDQLVLILMDRGERYLDTIYSETWVAEHIAPGASSISPPLPVRSLHG